MINLRRFEYRTQYEDYKNSSDYLSCSISKIGEAGINDASTVVKYAESPEEMTLIRHWDGRDAPTSSQWKDRIANQYWTITKGTHPSSYYQFLNTNPASVAQYATLNGVLPDLGYHWKIVLDCGIRTENTNPSTFYPLDFSSVISVASGKCAVAVGLSSSSQKWMLGPKFNGNDSGPTYNVSTASMTTETITNSQVWIRRTVTFGVRSSSVPGKDETFLYVPEKGEAISSNPFTPIRLNRWDSSKSSFLARSCTTPNSTYKYATSCRIYDIKVYYVPVV